MLQVNYKILLCFFYLWLLMFYSFESFSHQRELMAFYLNLKDSKFSQVSRTFLGILVNLNNVVVWIVFIGPPISKSSCSFINPLVTVPGVPITNGITVTFMSSYLSFFSLSFSFSLWSAETAKSTIRQILFFLITITRSGYLTEIRWSVCMSKSHRILRVSVSRIYSG